MVNEKQIRQGWVDDKVGGRLEGMLPLIFLMLTVQDKGMPQLIFTNAYTVFPTKAW